MQKSIYPVGNHILRNVPTEQHPIMISGKYRTIFERADNISMFLLPLTLSYQLWHAGHDSCKGRKKYLNDRHHSRRLKSRAN